MIADPNSPAMELYDELARAYVRAARPDLADLGDAECLDRARRDGLPLHRFKRTAGLPRVAKVLGLLRGLDPTSILDIGSGRGVFLWPLLHELRGVAVTAVDREPHRVRDIDCVARGGITRLAGVQADVRALPFEPRAFDIVTVLEVLEHLDDPERAATEVVRVARRFVIASVPSKADDNPGHIQLFDASSLTALFVDAGAVDVEIHAVLGHFVAVVKLGRPHA